eukprot:jgi/Orpsp1_1/1187400/evm.model.d7180000057425.1
MINYTYSINYYIANNSSYFDPNSNVYFDNLINSYQSENKKNENINIYFVDDYYDLTKKFSIDINLDTNVNFIGMSQNGTIFDYKNTRKGAMSIIYPDKNGYKITFTNIIFQNYYHNNENVSLFQMTSSPIEQKLYFYNCIFRNNEGYILKMIRYDGCNTNLDEDKYSTLSLENCQFYNNKELIIYIIMKETTALAVESVCQRVIIKNSLFEYNENIIKIQSGNLLIDNCIFNNNKSKNNDANAQLIDSYGKKNVVNIKNSHILNIDIKERIPLINIKSSGLTSIYNSTFKNIYSSYYYMMKVEQVKPILIEYSKFEETNTIFHSIQSTIIINDSLFANYNILNSLPLLNDGTSSDIYISNSDFHSI